MTNEQEAVFLQGLISVIQARLDAIRDQSLAVHSRRRGFQWDGDWSRLPPVLNCHHMAAIEGVQVECIWDRIQRRTMHPKPDRWWRPYRWNRNRVQAEIERD